MIYDINISCVLLNINIYIYIYIYINYTYIIHPIETLTLILVTIVTIIIYRCIITTNILIIFYNNKYIHTLNHTTIYFYKQKNLNMLLIIINLSVL